MTQPIQEPGPTTRVDSRLTWGSNQLFRRPGRAGLDPSGYEIPMGEKHNTNTQSIASGTGWTSVTLDAEQITTGTSEVTSITDGLGIGLGLWVVTGRVFWESPFQLGYSQILVNSTGSGSVALMSERSTDSEINRQVIIWPRPAYPSTVKLWVRQTSGTSKVLYSGLISVALLFGTTESFGAFS